MIFLISKVRVADQRMTPFHEPGGVWCTSDIHKSTPENVAISLTRHRHDWADDYDDDRQGLHSPLPGHFPWWDLGFMEA